MNPAIAIAVLFPLLGQGGKKVQVPSQLILKTPPLKLADASKIAAANRNLQFGGKFTKLSDTQTLSVDKLFVKNKASMAIEGCSLVAAPLTGPGYALLHGFETFEFYYVVSEPGKPHVATFYFPNVFGGTMHIEGKDCPTTDVTFTHGNPTAVYAWVPNKGGQVHLIMKVDRDGIVFSRVEFDVLR